MDIWDAWGICGNGTHRDGLQLLPGYEDDPRIVRDRSDEGMPGWCAGGPREAMAFAEIRAEAREIARAAWDLWRELSRSHPPAEPRRVVWDSPWPTPEEYRAGHQAEQERGRPSRAGHWSSPTGRAWPPSWRPTAGTTSAGSSTMEPPPRPSG
ncbi:hypothetical protein [Streptomyces virginiae]|uniref:hypothetical protein n=1 Tax=Streptomyces virginiae TaxID=1961 RepID=UPI002DD809E2|nr:hypothetical protein [Streptomyces virginiae]WSC80716.1 hypothetical protein OHA56_32720 [Streptomyces virginiae]